MTRLHPLLCVALIALVGCGESEPSAEPPARPTSLGEAPDEESAESEEAEEPGAETDEARAQAVEDVEAVEAPPADPVEEPQAVETATPSAHRRGRSGGRRDSLGGGADPLDGLDLGGGGDLRGVGAGAGRAGPGSRVGGSGGGDTPSAFDIEE